MLTKDDLDQIRGVVLDVVHNETRKIVQEELEPVKVDINTMKQDILVVSHKITGLELSAFRFERRIIGVEKDLIRMINAFGEEFGRVDKRLITIEGSLGIGVN